MNAGTAEIGGIEIYYHANDVGKLVVNVVAPGAIDPGVFKTDDDGDGHGHVDFLVNGRWAICADIRANQDPPPNGA